MDIPTNMFGNYRAKVVDNQDPEKQGKVIVWIPTIMPEIEKTKGIWARPANNPIGGRNMEDDSDHHYSGSCLVPPKGSWVWIFFEAGKIDTPFYFGSLDLGNTKVLPECQDGEYWNKWVVFKSPSGRCIVVSDDPLDERIEITGKKRQISDPPTGDVPSVYNIDGNQTTILFDEVEGREKILIRTRQGDFLHIDIDQRKLQCYFESDILMESGANIHIIAARDIKIKAGWNMHTEATQAMHAKSGMSMFQFAGGDHHTRAAKSVLRDGSGIADNSGAAEVALGSNPESPSGKRST